MSIYVNLNRHLNQINTYRGCIKWGILCLFALIIVLLIRYNRLTQATIEQFPLSSATQENFKNLSFSNSFLVKPDEEKNPTYRMYGYSDGRIILHPRRKIVTHQVNLLSKEERSEFVQRIVNPHDAECSTHRRLGRADDGGWDLCLVGPYTPKDPCVVMSFGINSIWEFDDELGNTFNCSIKAFDPTMKEEDHQRNAWVRFFKKGIGSGPKVLPKVGPVDSFLNLLKSLKLQDRDIDVLKIDVEWHEWDALKTAFADGSLSKVKQLAIEFHASPRQPVEETQRVQFTLNEIYKQNFRAWNYNWNNICKFKTKRYARTQCNEVYFINTNYLLEKDLIY